MTTKKWVKALPAAILILSGAALAQSDAGQSSMAPDGATQGSSTTRMHSKHKSKMHHGGSTANGTGSGDGANAPGAAGPMGGNTGAGSPGSRSSMSRGTNSTAPGGQQ